MLLACSAGPPAATGDAAAAGDAASGCSADSDCDDGSFCNGAERCEPAAGGADASGCVRGSAPCAADCDEAADRCVEDCAGRDADGDGEPEIGCGGTDCDDRDPNRFPAAVEVCDAIDRDEDCDPTTFGDLDADDDGEIDRACCNIDAGVPICGTDCDDADPARSRMAAELCNDVDDDCDEMVDEGCICEPGETAPCPGALGECATGVVTCVDGFSWSACSVEPADEICDAEDDDCDGVVDETVTRTCYRDDDDDGVAAADAVAEERCPVMAIPGVATCPAMSSEVPPSTLADCCDSDASVYPGQTRLFTTRSACGGYQYDCIDGTIRFSEDVADVTVCTGRGSRSSCESRSAELAAAPAWLGSAPGCGVSADAIVGCRWVNNPSPIPDACVADVAERAQGCR